MIFTGVCIEIKNNKARHNLSNAKSVRMAFRLVDGSVVDSFLEPIGQTNAQPPEGDYMKFVLIRLNTEKRGTYRDFQNIFCCFWRFLVSSR